MISDGCTSFWISRGHGQAFGVGGVAVVVHVGSSCVEEIPLLGSVGEVSGEVRSSFDKLRVGASAPMRRKAALRVRLLVAGLE